MTGNFVFAFMVGAVSSVNPCGFALLPAYFARRLGLADDNTHDIPSKAGVALAAGAITTTGGVMAFGLLGGAASLGAAWLGSVLPWAGFAIGILLIGVGLYVLAGNHIGLRFFATKVSPLGGGLKGDFLFGFGYGVASLSCTLPIFLSITALATTESLIESTLSFIAFGLGMGTILTAIAVTAALSHEGLANTFKKFFPYANKFGGAVMLLAGAYIVFYWGSLLMSSEIPSSTGLIAQGEQISGTLKMWVGGDVGQAVLFSLFGCFVASTIWVFWKRSKTKPQHIKEFTQ